MRDYLVQDWGEQRLLQRLFRFCNAALVGDDAAVLPLPIERWEASADRASLVTTTDMLVDGVHFSVGLANPGVHTTDPADVGWRSVAANLSDLAAMGAAPLSITVALGLPGELPVAWLEALYEGIVACLKPWNTPIVGGDLCRSPVLTVAIAAFGTVHPQRVIRRSVAQAGDAILVTGVHGASRAGLEILLNPVSGQFLGEGDRHALTRAHQRPHPRLDILAALENLSPAPNPIRIAGMDSSDGLADAVLQICRASGVGAVIERSRLPLPPAFTPWLPPQQALDWALYGGEDFELVLCLPPELAENLGRSLPHSQIIGHITADPTVLLHDAAHPNTPQPLQLNQGFQHFSAPI